MLTTDCAQLATGEGFHTGRSWLSTITRCRSMCCVLQSRARVAGKLIASSGCRVYWAPYAFRQTAPALERDFANSSRERIAND